MLKKERIAPQETGKAKVQSSRTTFWQSNARAAAIATKMVRDRMQVMPAPGEGVTIPNENIFTDLLESRARKNLDAETIMDLQPDVKLIRHMITSVMMSPIDMDAGGLSYSVEDSDLPGIITNPITDIIRQHFTTYIPLDEELPEIIGEALFDRGAVARVIVPEAVIDDMINRSGHYTTEDFRQNILDDDGVTFRPTGILGDVTTKKQAREQGINGPVTHKKVSMESMFFQDLGMPSTRINDMVSITDNISVLKMPILKDQMRKNYVAQAMRGNVAVKVNRAAMESSSATGQRHFSDVRRLRDTLYARNTIMQNSSRQIQVMKTASQASRSSIGHPLRMKVRSGSLVPAFVPGSPDEHLGYIMAIDATGYPIDIVADMKENISKGLGSLDNSQAMNLTSTLIQQTQILNSGYDYNETRRNNGERIRLYNQILEENILNRMKNGIMGANVKLGRNEDFYSMIQARNWANESVHLVFIPAEQVAYYAYDYDENGMGKSLLDGVTQTSTLRIMTNFANFMAAVNNAVGRTKVAINIDPRTPDPEKAATIMTDEYLRTQAGASPTDVTSASEMFRTLRQMGVVFEIQGHPGLPNTTVDVESFTANRPQIDQSFTDALRNEQYMGLYVTPDMVDMTQQGDFAITRWTSNQLFTKRIITLQTITCKHVRKDIETYVRSDGELIRQIQQAIRENEDKLPEAYKDLSPEEEHIQYQTVIDEYFRAFVVELPNPNSTQSDTMLDQLNKKASLVDETIKYYMGADLYDPLMDEDKKAYIETMAVWMKAHLMRKYIENEGIMPEIQDFVRTGTDDNPALNLVKEANINWTNLVGNIGDFAAAMQLRAEQREQWLANANPNLSNQIKNGETPTDDNPDDNNDDNNDDEFNDEFNNPGDDPSLNNGESNDFSTTNDNANTGDAPPNDGGDAAANTDGTGAPGASGSTVSGAQPPAPQAP